MLDGVCILIKGIYFSLEQLRTVNVFTTTTGSPSNRNWYKFI